MNEQEIINYINDFNKIRSKIRFTHEYQKDDKINFLDTTLSKDKNGNINIRWFRKDTASDRLLNYNSNHSPSIKVNLIHNMTTKIIQTTTDKLEQNEDLEKLKNILTKSNYPPHIINKHMNYAKIKSNTPNRPTNKKSEYKYSITLH